MRVIIRPNTYIYLIILLFLIPLQWLIAWLIAMAFHEFCHWIAVRLCGGNIDLLMIGIGGIDMRCGLLTDRKRLLCLLCGPLSGFILAAFGLWFPKIAICGWVLSIYNLLPVLPLDGGRVLQILLNNDTRFQLVQTCIFALLGVLTVYAAFFLGFGVLPILVTGLLWLKNRKIPCNKGVFKLQ